MSKYPAVRSLFLRALGDPPAKGRQKQVAVDVRTSEANVSRWVKGEARPNDPEQWGRLSEALGVTVAEIREAVESPPGHPPTDLEARLDELFTVVRDASQIRGNQIDAIARAVEANGKLLKALTAAVRRIEAAQQGVQPQPRERPSEHKRSGGRPGARSVGDGTPHRGTHRPG